MGMIDKELIRVTINDPALIWLRNPVSLKNFDREIRTIFKERWKSWVGKWILVIDGKGHSFKIRLIQQEDGRLYPEVEKSKGRLINFYGGILIGALKRLIYREGE